MDFPNKNDNSIRPSVPDFVVAKTGNSKVGVNVTSGQTNYAQIRGWCK